MRFDEQELEPAVEVEEVAEQAGRAPWLRRVMAFLTDLSLFAALALALSPLLPPNNIPAIAALGGFVLVVSYYYFVGSWLLWGKTIGGTIFDVRVVRDGQGTMSLKSASRRWAAMLLSLATAGLGFLAGLPNRWSGTRAV